MTCPSHAARFGAAVSPAFRCGVDVFHCHDGVWSDDATTAPGQTEAQGIQRETDGGGEALPEETGTAISESQLAIASYAEQRSHHHRRSAVGGGPLSACSKRGLNTGWHGRDARAPCGRPEALFEPRHVARARSCTARAGLGSGDLWQATVTAAVQQGCAQCCPVSRSRQRQVRHLVSRGWCVDERESPNCSQHACRPRVYHRDLKAMVGASGRRAAPRHLTLVRVLR